MGLVLLVLLYLALAAAFALPAVWRLGAVGRVGPPWTGGTASPWAALFLTLVPLAFTWGAFLPGKTLAPTPMLAGIPPWSEPERTAAVVGGSSSPNPLLLDPTSQFVPWRHAARSDLLLNPAQA
ncbi:MAG TPA: hypothetical protein VM617_01655, partial [Thermoanaerobaculia bacterium]|nr:hypothetical protein [Thermoanaerobaculia bacterium]